MRVQKDKRRGKSEKEDFFEIQTRITHRNTSVIDTYWLTNSLTTAYIKELDKTMPSNESLVNLPFAN